MTRTDIIIIERTAWWTITGVFLGFIVGVGVGTRITRSRESEAKI